MTHEDAADYCRQIEAYLCGKNEGHLIRIVGPVFEKVCGWAAQGVPLKVAFRGIDQYCERYYAKGPRRRPVRVEFCEADILELFDDWRRAVGVPRGTESAAGERRESLAKHIDRVIVRLTSLRAGTQRTAAFEALLDATIHELDAMARDAKQARGGARERIIARLAQLDDALVRAAQRELTADAAASLEREAATELAPFGPRLDSATRARAVEAAMRRLIRDGAALPTLTYE